MIYYDHLPLSEGVLQALSSLEIEYVFQPIFLSDGKTVYAREALMRPHGTTVTELINEYTELGQLHILEVATFFGAMQAYLLRGYSEPASINSFPSECFEGNEGQVFDDYFGDVSGKLIVELLEYPSFSLEKWKKKKATTVEKNTLVSLDDYGCGLNDIERVHQVDPHIVKLDRSLISDIDKHVEKQKNCAEIVDILRDKNMKIVAEGVETKEEFDYLVSLGIDYFQGYYLAKPS